MTNINQPSPQSGRSLITFIVGLVALILIALGGYWSWERNSGPESDGIGGFLDHLKSRKFLRNFDEEMRRDKFGGKTPEETLQLFIEALEKGDVELASRYFMLESDQYDPNYLTRKVWEDALKKAKEGDRLDEIVTMLNMAKPAGSSSAGYFGFEVKNEKGELVSDVGMRLNEKSGVWKIESL